MEDTSLNDRLNNIFAGKMVRKDLTKKIKEGANVPVYVLEYLLGKQIKTDVLSLLKSLHQFKCQTLT